MRGHGGQRPTSRRFARLGTVVGAVALIAAACTPANPIPPITSGPIDPVNPAGASDRVLVFSRTAGFRHESIPTGVNLLRRELPSWGIAVDDTEEADAFTDANLARYDAVVFNNTTGDVLDDAQQAAFERFIRAGGSYVGVHAAADTEYDWPFYGEMVGAYFTRHPVPFGMRIRVEDRNQFATALLPRTFGLFEEIYDFDRNPRNDPSTTVLMTVADSYSVCDAIGGALVGPGCELTRVPSDFTNGADHPVAWQKEFQGGRSFYTNLGHNPGTWERPEFVNHLIGGIRWAVGEDRRDQANVVADGLDSPLRLDVAPDGQVWVIEKAGAVIAVDASSGRRRVAGRLAVNTFGEQGLLGIALDPAFAVNRTLYLYGVEGGEMPEGVLASYRLDARGELDIAGRNVFLRIPVDGGTHHGGAIEIDSDGTLLLATGDTTNPFESAGFSPIDERPGREGFDAQRSAGNPNDLRGKVLRVRTDGSIPAGNLFPGGVGGRAEIYAMGLRNPFSIAVGDDGQRVVGDVGPDSFLDGNPGPRGEDELNLLDAPGDFGWPRCIGNRRGYRDKDFATGALGPAFDCSATSAPALSYDYLTVSEWALADGGRTAIAGDIFDPADLSGPFAQPAHRKGEVLMSEWSRSRLLSVRLGADGRATKVDRLMPHLGVRALDLGIAPDGAIYAVEYGQGGPTGRLLRIEHAADGAQRPTVTIGADQPSGPSPLTVALSADAATVTRGETVDRIEWDLDDDDVIDRTGAAINTTFAGSGDRLVRAWAVSSTGRRSLAATRTITVGNTPPALRLTQSPPGVVTSGQTLNYRVEVTDAEDGSSALDPTLCGRIRWRVSLAHNNHEHPDAEQVGGCTLSSTVSLDDQHAPGASLGWSVSATFTDLGTDGTSTDALSAIASVRAPYSAGGPSDPLAGLPVEVRSFLTLLGENPPLDQAIRSVDWHFFVTNGFQDYLR